MRAAPKRGGFTVAAVSWLLGAALTGLITESVDASRALAAYAGDLDSSFAGDGVVTTPISDDLGARDAKMVVQADGKIVVAATVTLDSWVAGGVQQERWAVALLRFLPDGTPDPSFGGGDGQTITDLPDFHETVTEAVLAADGKILLAVAVTRSEFVVLRYTVDGQLDPTFDGDGVASVPMVPGYNYTGALAVQSDGRIIVGGGAQDVSTGEQRLAFTLARLTTTGGLDPTFGTGGQVATLVDQSSQVSHLAVDGLGRIVAAGGAWNVNSHQGAVARYLEDGTLDTAFSGDGVLPGLEREIAGVAIDDGNRVLLAASSDYAPWGGHASVDVVVRRLTEAGAFDTSFGNGNSFVQYNLANSYDRVHALKRQPDGALLLAGATGAYGPDSGFVMMLTPTGARDTTFSRDGLATFGIPPGGGVEAQGVHMLPDRRFLVAGSVGSSTSSIGSRQIFLTRLLWVDDPSLTVSSASGNETDSGTGTVSFPVSLSRAADRPVEVSYRTLTPPPDGGYAEPGVDYVAASGTLTLAAGQTSGQIDVMILPDDLSEGYESFELEITGIAGPANIQYALYTGSIVDDEPMPEVSVADATLTEGASPGALEFRISFSRPFGRPATVYFNTGEDSARENVDYAPVSDLVVFAPGEVSQVVRVFVADDTVYETAETVRLYISTEGIPPVTDWFGVGTINDNDPMPTLSIADVSRAEGNAGTTAFDFPVSLSAVRDEPTSVTYRTIDGTATAGSDYASQGPSVLTIAAGQTSAIVSVAVSGDADIEPDEQFTVELSNPVGASIADGQGVGTIRNDDERTSLAIGDASVDEGNSGPTLATFTITRSGPLGDPSTVVWATANNSAGAGSDYVAVPATTVSFGPGETTKAVSVTVNGDLRGEPDETFFVKLSSPTGAVITDGTGLGTIVNDDTSLAVNDVTVAEGDSGTKQATFTITRAGATAGTSTVKWATANNTATAGSDYVGVAGTTVTFAPGETTRSASVTVNGDTQGEPNETFFVKLSSPSGATIFDDSGLGLITNDDTALSVNDVTVTEGDSGPTTATFTISRTGPTTGSSSVQWATANYSAGAGTDYVAVPPTTVTFGPGETTKSVSVTVNGDIVGEATEAFLLKLSSPTGATLLDGSGFGVITNDDTSVAVNDVTVSEGNSGTTLATFTVTRAGAVAGTSSVAWATADGSATAGSDYVGVAPTTLTFAAGETRKTVSVTVNGDTQGEPNETFFVKLTSPAGTKIADGSGLGLITNDDTAFSVNDVTVTEGNSGETAATFTITRTGPNTGTSSVAFATADNSATAGSDYVAVPPTTVTFTPGVVTRTVSVTVLGDTTVERTEAFFVKLTSPVGGSIMDGTGLGVITNDDVSP